MNNRRAAAAAQPPHSPQQPAQSRKFSDVARVAFFVICAVGCAFVLLQHHFLSSYLHHDGAERRGTLPGSGGAASRLKESGGLVAFDPERHEASLLHPRILLSYMGSSPRSDRGAVEQPKLAYVTYVAGDEPKQVAAAAALMLSLAQTDSRHDRVILVASPAVSERSCSLLSKFAHIIKVEGSLLAMDAPGSQIGDRPAGQDEDTYLLVGSLLGLVQCWKLTMFDRVAFVPLGTVALRNLDDIFDVPGIAVVQNEAGGGGGRQSGAAANNNNRDSTPLQLRQASIVVLAPNKYVFAMALDAMMRAPDVEGVEMFVHALANSRPGSIGEVNRLSPWYLARHFHAADAAASAAAATAAATAPHHFATEEHEQMLLSWQQQQQGGRRRGGDLDPRIRALHISLSTRNQVAFFHSFVKALLQLSPSDMGAGRQPLPAEQRLASWAEQVELVTRSDCGRRAATPDGADVGADAPLSRLFLSGVALLPSVASASAASSVSAGARRDNHALQSLFLLRRCLRMLPSSVALADGAATAAAKKECFLNTSLMSVAVAPELSAACGASSKSNQGGGGGVAASRNITLVCGVCMRRSTVAHTAGELADASDAEQGVDPSKKLQQQMQALNAAERLALQKKRNAIARRESTYDVVDCGAAATFRFGCVDATCQSCAGAMTALRWRRPSKQASGIVPSSMPSSSGDDALVREAQDAHPALRALRFFGTDPADVYAVVDEMTHRDYEDRAVYRSTAFAQGVCQGDTTMFHCVDDAVVLVTYCAGGAACSKKCTTTRVRAGTELIQTVAMAPPESLPPASADDASRATPWMADLWTVRCVWRKRGKDGGGGSGMSAKLLLEML